MSVKQLMTVEDLWELPEKSGVRLELVDGKLIESPPLGALAGMVSGHVWGLIDDFVRSKHSGLTFVGHLGFVLGRDPGRLRIPDVSFVSRDRVPADGLPEGFWPGPPDLAVEIVSPHDRAEDVRAKVSNYLDAGTRTVWVLWPRDQSVTVYQAGGQVKDLGPRDELDGGDVLPGFRVQVADLFDVQPAR